jgi:ribosomal protein S21
MVEVIAGSDFESSLKFFKRCVQRDGILEQVKARRQWVKPSEKLKAKMRKAALRKKRLEKRRRSRGGDGT